VNKNTSLSSRLIAYWIVGSILAFFTIPATVYLPLTALKIGEYANTNLEGWTTKRARDLVVDALREDTRAGEYVELTDALRAHMARNPEFRFAVFDAGTGSLLSGSSGELASHFDSKSDVEVVGSMFHLANDPNVAARGYYRTVDTPIGRVKVIVYGAQFHWDDILYQLYNYLTFTNFLAYLPLCSVMSVVAFIIVRRGLAPLRSVAARVANIDVNSLDQRISRTTLPAEVLPFVDAVNSAFDRVHEGVARQKRFTANAAHELRTPIAILRARVHKLQEKPLKHEIERDVRRIQSIVEQLLVLAQVREKDFAPNTTINLNEIALSVGADFMPIAIDNQRNMALESQEPPFWCVAIAGRSKASSPIS
jgi:signal transduction histidine kinase